MLNWSLQDKTLAFGLSFIAEADSILRHLKYHQGFNSYRYIVFYQFVKLQLKARIILWHYVYLLEDINQVFRILHNRQSTRLLA
jgi:hypothetical protein